ncbi:MAG: hypothetical protein ACRED1_13035, partial [Limisphaerales bacterium]
GRKARQLFQNLLEHGRVLERAAAKIDYFATSLPTMLLFEDDLQLRQEIRGLFLQAQALLGLGKPARAAALMKRVLHLDPNHAAAADLCATSSARMASAPATGPGGNEAAQRSQ